MVIRRGASPLDPRAPGKPGKNEKRKEMEHYTVLHIEKQRGSGGGLSAHIERQRWDGEEQRMTDYQPDSVTHPERTALNKDYILQPGDGRTAAIERRIKEAGITRKIKDDAVKAICIICSSDHEKMAEIERAGRIDQWAGDCIAWAQREFGRENVVSAALHMDETSPHLHLTVVPIAMGQARERKPRPATDESGQPVPTPAKRKIRKQQVNARLCARDIMTPAAMKRWQTDFAASMGAYGMVRGIEGSKAPHEDPKLYNAQMGRAEKALGIVGLDKKSRQRRETFRSLEKENRTLRAEKKAMEAQHPREVEKAVEIEKKRLTGQLSAAIEKNKQLDKRLFDAQTENIRQMAEIDKREKEVDNLKATVKQLATDLLTHLHGWEDAVKAIRRRLQDIMGDFTKDEKVAISNVKAQVGEKTKKPIAQAMYDTARQGISQTPMRTRERMERVRDEVASMTQMKGSDAVHQKDIARKKGIKR